MRKLGLNPRNTSYHSPQNNVFSNFLPESPKNKTYKTVCMSVGL
jgi:hypothetical protein